MQRLLALGFAVASIACACLAIYLLTRHNTAYWGAASAHVASVGFGAEAICVAGARSKRKWVASVRRSGWLLGLAFPVVGVLVYCIWVVRTPHYQGLGHAESRESKRARAARQAIENRRAEQELGSGIESIIDALSDRDPNVRIAAIDALRGQNSKAAVKILQEARENSVFDVRVRAVEELGRINKSFNDSIGTLRLQLKEDPHNAEKNLRLAQVLKDYHGLRLEAPQLTRPLLEQALAHAQAAKESEGKGSSSALVVGELLLLSGRFEEAEKVFQARLDEEGFEVDALRGLAESQFRRKDYRALRSTALLGLEHKDEVPTKLQGFLALWTRSAPEVQVKAT